MKTTSGGTAAKGVPEFEYPNRKRIILRGFTSVAKDAQLPLMAVRTRRAYFDCRFGQLHVRTAFPATGGFGEQVPLFCLHSDQNSSRAFGRFLSEIADVRSVYAPDLPGLGESDPSPAATLCEAAGAIADLADDLRLRQIDLLGIHSGARLSMECAAARPELVRRMVLVAMPGAERLPRLEQQALIMRTRLETPSDSARLKSVLPNGTFVDIDENVSDLFAAAPQRLAKQIGMFLGG